MTRPTPHVLMCPPDFFGIEYEINPWMRRSQQSDPTLARQQWQSLHDLIEQCGARISLVDPVRGLPDLVFTANAALIYRRRAIMSHFRHDVRQREVPYFEEALRRLGFTTQRVPNDVYFEGAGDALFIGDTLIAGYRIRSDAQGHQWIGRQIGCRVLPLELVDPYYYHLDTCFCPLSFTEAIYYPEAFDDYGRRALAASVETLIAVSKEEATHFACNAVVLGRHVITNTGCPKLHEALLQRGYEPHATPLGEFVKSGGSAKCLTLRLDGEDAAAWRTLNDQPAADGNAP